MLKLAVCIATMRPKEEIRIAVSVFNTTVTNIQAAYHYNTPEHNDGVIGSYDAIYRDPVIKADVLAYIHDDVTIYERGWDERVLKEFEDPSVGVVGFGGALRHGTDAIYKTPYRLQQLARDGYLSNVDDAEVHGERFEGARDVAVLDGFCLVVRRELLDKCGGWTNKLQFHSYDYFICCIAHRFGYRVRVVGVRCHHHGGRTSTTKEYQEWAVKHGTSDSEVHRLSHQFIYSEFRDVLPWDCTDQNRLGVSSRNLRR